ncbi:MAG TPA: glycosyltransferase family 4 protein, partial [Terriglobales bacterium]|nr:glycosyltransferase family 4 protein [Terriglobales bacterium]
MRISLSALRPFHFVMLAHALRRHSDRVEIYSSAPRKFFKGLDPSIRTHLVPAPIQVALRVLPAIKRRSWAELDSPWYDFAVSSVIGKPDLLFGLATQSLHSAGAVKARGGLFVLDRACPHVDFQQSLVRREAELVGADFTPQPAWMRDRQLREYELADAILVPSAYSARSFPAEFQAKVVKAPLLGRAKAAAGPRTAPNKVFTVGVLGGSPLRKGYLYLLQAWKKLALPNAKLRIRAGDGFAPYPALEKLVSRMPNVEMVGYVPNISDFYRSCDVFVLPSVDDGFGMALFEAMSNYVACVATSNVGASELLTDGHDGIVVEPANSDQLAAAILR